MKSFTRLIPMLFVANVFASVANGQSTDWEVLFDGSSKQHWRTYGEVEPANEWQILGDTLTLVLEEGADLKRDRTLISKETYADFELELEWRISTGGNSGIFYRVQEMPGVERAYKTGIEMQVLDNTQHQNGKNPLTQAGAAYGLYAPVADALKPVGEFNHVRIVARGNHIEHWLNGVMVVSFQIYSADWEKRIKDTKFADWPYFALFNRGHIALQDHGDRVSYRNIRIRRL